MDGYVELTAEKIATPEGVNEVNRMLLKLFEFAVGDGDSVRVYKGYGAPTLSAGVGSLYQRLDGGANTTLYVREASGWIAK